MAAQAEALQTHPTAVEFEQSISSHPPAQNNRRRATKNG
jgi:hypothetical protein